MRSVEISPGRFTSILINIRKKYNDNYRKVVFLAVSDDEELITTLVSNALMRCLLEVLDIWILGIR